MGALRRETPPWSSKRNPSQVLPVMGVILSFPIWILIPYSTVYFTRRRRFSRFFASVVVAVRRFGVDAAAKASLLDFDEALATNRWAEGPSITEAGFYGFGKKISVSSKILQNIRFFMFKNVRFLCSIMFVFSWGKLFCGINALLLL